MTVQVNVQEKNPRLGRHAVIVGGGISGLSTAFFLSRRAAREHLPLKITVLEASDRFGGVLRTLTYEDFRIEAGADAFYAGRNDATDLCRELGLQEDMIEAAPCFRRFFRLKDKKFFPVPNLPDSFFDAIQFLRDPRLSFSAKCRIFGEPFIARRKKGEDESLASFFCRRLGRGFYREVVKPLVRGVYMMDPERASLEALFPQLQKAEKIYGSLAGSFFRKILKGNEKNPVEFLTLKQGLEGLVQALVRELGACENWPSRPSERAGIVGIPACELRRSVPVRQCTYNAGWEILLEGGAALKADVLCLAMNACDSARLLSGAAPGLSRELSALRYDSIATVNIIYKAGDAPAGGMGPGFLVPMDGGQYPFSSLKWVGTSADGKCILLRAFLSETMIPEVFSKSDEMLKQEITAFLKDLLAIRAQPLLIDVKRYPSALPQYETGHLERVSQIERSCLQYPGLFFAGNGFRGFGITDCIHRAAIAVSKLQFLPV